MSLGILAISGSFESHVKGMRSVEILRVWTDGVIPGEDAPKLAGSSPKRRMEMLAESVDGVFSRLSHVCHAQESVAERVERLGDSVIQ